ncbi:MAG: hypothetical protein K6A69_03750 [Lachnospiraceae bacterium]|nr:hypothetical protein [Lachnospiraceae bacterium]
MAEETEELSKKELKEKKKAEKAAAKEAKKAAKAEEELEEQDDSPLSKFLLFLVAFMIIVVWLVIFALVIKMDVGGFGSTVLYPILKDVPVVNKILPETEEYVEEDDPYHFATMDDAVARIKELEAVIAKSTEDSTVTAAYIAELEAQSAELQQYKANQAAFETEKEKFYEEVVFSDQAPDINEYKEYYESIEPENAAAIYRQVVGQVQTDQELESYVSAYSQMKPAQAAAIFNTMTEDLRLVAKILSRMDAKQRGDILGAMDTATAALVTELMEP